MHYVLIKKTYIVYIYIYIYIYMYYTLFVYIINKLGISFSYNQ